MRQLVLPLTKTILFGLIFNLIILNAQAQLDLVKKLNLDEPPKYLVEYQGKFIFGIDGELFITDGTSEGTLQIGQFNNNNNNYHSFYFIEYNNALYFISRDSREASLWKTDGSRRGTQLIHRFSSQVTNPFIFNNKLYFGEYKSSYRQHYVRLWTSDGTPENTQMIKDLTPLGYTSFSRDFFLEFKPFTDKIYIVIGKRSIHLWQSDGTTSGTELVHEKFGSNVRDNYFIGDGYILYSTRDWISEGVYEYPIFECNMITKSVVKVGDMSINLRYHVFCEGKPYFGRTNRVYYDVSKHTFITDNDCTGNNQGSQVFLFHWKGGNYYIDNKERHKTLVRIDEVSQQQENLMTVASYASLSGFTTTNDYLYFTTKAGVWRTDGSSLGTINLLPFRPGKVFFLNGQTFIFTRATTSSRGKVNLYALGTKPFPGITGLFPTTGCPGDTINLEGYNFTSDVSKLVVEIGGKRAQITAASAQVVQFIVPKVSDVVYPAIQVDGEWATTNQRFDVKIAVTNWPTRRGAIGDTIIIDGKGFIPYKDLGNGTYEPHNWITVRVDYRPWQILNVSDDKITVRIPLGAHSGSIRVVQDKVFDQKVDLGDFEITSVQVGSLAPDQASLEDVVTIYGEHFYEGMEVYFYGTDQKAEIVSVDTKQLQVKVPAGAQTGLITVLDKQTGNRLTTSKRLFVNPTISVSPNFGLPGDKVTIYATGFLFDALARNRVVKFNGVSTSDIDYQSNRITVWVPEGATNGKVQVINDGKPFLSNQDFRIGTALTNLINSLKNRQLTLYPNPVGDVLRLQLEGATSGQLQLTVYDTRGKKTLEQAALLQNGVAVLDLTSLPSGQYILKIQAGDQSLSHSIWKR